MRTSSPPILPAHIHWEEDGTPFCTRFGDIYRARGDAPAESRHVFLEGAELPRRWQALPRNRGGSFHIGETGFGAGINFLSTWQAWRHLAPPDWRLCYLSLELFPLSVAQLRRALHPWEQLAPLARLLLHAYPPLLGGLHCLDFDQGRVRLLLFWGDAQHALPDLLDSEHPAFAAEHGAKMDAWFLDGFAPARNPRMWSRELFHGIAQLSRPGARCASYSSAGAVRRALDEAGFEVHKAPGYGRKRTMLRGILRHPAAAPGHTAASDPAPAITPPAASRTPPGHAAMSDPIPAIMPSAASRTPPGHSAASDPAPAITPPGYGAMSDLASAITPPGHTAVSDPVPTITPPAASRPTPGHGAASDPAPAITPPGYGAMSDLASAITPPGHAAVSDPVPTITPPAASRTPPGHGAASDPAPAITPPTALSGHAAASDPMPAITPPAALSGHTAASDPAPAITPPAASRPTPAPSPRAGLTPWYLPPPAIPREKRQAVVIGAGLAGVFSAWSLVRRGWQVQLLEAGAHPAAGASANRRANFYGAVAPAASPAGAFALHSFLYAAQLYRDFFARRILRSGKDGELCGALLLESPAALADGAMPLLDRKRASRLAGVPLPGAAHHCPQGGWIDCDALCRRLVEHLHLRVQSGVTVAALQWRAPHWQALDAAGATLAAAPILVLANALGAADFPQTAHVPLKAVRGQSLYLPLREAGKALRCVLCGKGYVTPAADGYHGVGATFDADQHDTTLRRADQQRNLEILASLCPALASSYQDTPLRGHVALRCTTPDRLPLVGAAPDAAAFRHCYAALRRHARRSIAATAPVLPGLYMNIGHGARGLSSAPLGAELLAALLCGEVRPVPRPLLAALSPARFLLRELCRDE